MKETTEVELDDDILAEAEAELEDEAVSKKTYKRMTDAEFAEATVFWELGTKTLQEMADIYGITRASLHERFARAGIKRGSRVQEMAAAAEEKVHDEQTVKIERIRSTRDNHYIYAEALAKMTMQTILSARQEKRSIASTDPDLAALGKAAKTLEILRKERYALLDLDKEGGDATDIPELLISELSPDQLDQIRQEQLEYQKSQAENSNGIDDILNTLDIEEEGIV